MGAAVDIQDPIARNDSAPELAAAIVAPASTDRTEKIWWSVSLALGLLSLWFVKYVIYSDGISYLDIAAKYRAGDWSGAVNAYWSPLYSWLIALDLWILHPSAQWEAAQLHVINFLAFAGALFTFRFFLRQMTLLVTEHGGLCSERERRAWTSVGYAIFLWSGLGLSPLRLVTPDGISNLLLYLIAGSIIVIKRGNRSPALFAGLGFLFALCYFARTALFVAPLIFALALLVSARPFREVWRGVIITLTVFGVVIAPWVIAISRHTGHWTLGESGKLNYAWEVSGTLRSFGWEGDPGTRDMPIHPPRELLKSPPIFEFSTPIRATYAPWYDPSWWYAGIRLKFDLVRQLRTLFLNVRLAGAVLLCAPVFLWCLGATLMNGGFRKRFGASLSRTWWCWAPALCLIGGYAVVFVETRYIAGCVGIVALSVAAAAFTMPLSAGYTRAAVRLALASCIVSLALPAFVALYTIARDIRNGREMYPNSQFLLSKEAENLGLRRGAKIAFIGSGVNEDWPRILGVQIIADITDRPARSYGLFLSAVSDKRDLYDYWRATPEIQQTVMDLFRRNGAEAVAADLVPEWADTTGWIHLKTPSARVYGNSWSYLRFLRPPDEATVRRGPLRTSVPEHPLTDLGKSGDQRARLVWGQ